MVTAQERTQQITAELSNLESRISAEQERVASLRQQKKEIDLERRNLKDVGTAEANARIEVLTSRSRELNRQIKNNDLDSLFGRRSTLRSRLPENVAERKARAKQQSLDNLRERQRTAIAKSQRGERLSESELRSLDVGLALEERRSREARLSNNPNNPDVNLLVVGGELQGAIDRDSAERVKRAVANRLDSVNAQEQAFVFRGSSVFDPEFARVPVSTGFQRLASQRFSEINNRRVASNIVVSELDPVSPFVDRFNTLREENLFINARTPSTRSLGRAKRDFRQVQEGIRQLNFIESVEGATLSNAPERLALFGGINLNTFSGGANSLLFLGESTTEGLSRGLEDIGRLFGVKPPRERFTETGQRVIDTRPIDFSNVALTITDFSSFGVSRGSKAFRTALEVGEIRLFDEALERASQSRNIFEVPFNVDEVQRIPVARRDIGVTGFGGRELRVRPLLIEETRDIDTLLGLGSFNNRVNRFDDPVVETTNVLREDVQLTLFNQVDTIQDFSGFSFNRRDSFNDLIFDELPVLATPDSALNIATTPTRKPIAFEVVTDNLGRQVEIPIFPDLVTKDFTIEEALRLGLPTPSFNPKITETLPLGSKLTLLEVTDRTKALDNSFQFSITDFEPISREFNRITNPDRLLPSNTLLLEDNSFSLDNVLFSDPLGLIQLGRRVELPKLPKSDDFAFSLPDELPIVNNFASSLPDELSIVDQPLDDVISQNNIPPIFALRINSPSPFGERSNFISIQDFSTSSIFSESNKSISAVDVLLQQDNVVRIDSQQSSEQLRANEQSFRLAQNEITKTATEEINRTQQTITQQKIRQKPILRINPEKPIISPITQQTPRRTRTPRTNNNKRKKRNRKEKPFFIVQVGFQGQEFAKEFSGGVEAITQAVDKVLADPSASLKITPVNKSAKSINVNDFVPKEFRRSKKDSNRFVERDEFRIDNPSEIRNISGRGQSKIVKDFNLANKKANNKARELVSQGMPLRKARKLMKEGFF